MKGEPIPSCPCRLPKPNRSLNVWTFLWLHLCVRHSRPSNEHNPLAQNNRKWEGCFITFPSLAQTWKGYSGLTLTGSTKNLKRNGIPARFPAQLNRLFETFQTGFYWRSKRVGAYLRWTQIFGIYTSLLNTSLHAVTWRSPGCLLSGVRVTFTYTCSAQGGCEANGSHTVLPPAL